MVFSWLSVPHLCMYKLAAPNGIETHKRSQLYSYIIQKIGDSLHLSHNPTQSKYEYDYGNNQDPDYDFDPYD